MEIPEIRVYEEENIIGLAEYLEDIKGEQVETPKIRQESTSKNGFTDTDKVHEVLDELEKASFVQCNKGVLNDSWEVNGFYNAQDAINYLTQDDYEARRPHPLGSDFSQEQLKGWNPRTDESLVY